MGERDNGKGGLGLCEGEHSVSEITTRGKCLNSKPSITEHLAATSTTGTLDRMLLCNRRCTPQRVTL